MAINNKNRKTSVLDLADQEPQKETKTPKGPGVSDSKNDGNGIDIIPTSDYKVNDAGKKYRAHRINFNKGEDDKKTMGVTEQMKKTYKELSEVLAKNAAAGEWIHDFVHSDNPKFAGKSKEMRKKMALAAYYAKQQNEELKGGQVKLDKNKNGKLDAEDFKKLRKEELDEAIDANDYTATSEKSQFGGHRPHVVNKETGKTMMLGQHSYKSPEHAEAHAKAYLTGYAKLGMHAADRAGHSYATANKDKQVIRKEEAMEENWDAMLAHSKKMGDASKKTTKTYHDVKKTSTGTVYTKQFDKDGTSKGTGGDAAAKAEGAPKRGRGRPKKDKFAESVEMLMSLSEEQFDSMMEEGFDAFFEAYEQLDELSKTTLGSYAKKASKEATINRKIGADFENRADKARSPSMKDANKRLSADYKSKSWKRADGVDKAVDRLTK